MNEPLDARGLLCPLPVLKTRKRLKSLEKGAELEIITDDPAAVIDMPHFCNQQGHELISAEPDGAEMRFRIRKG